MGWPAAPEPCGPKLPWQTVPRARAITSPATKRWACAEARLFQGWVCEPSPGAVREQSMKNDSEGTEELLCAKTDFVPRCEISRQRRAMGGFGKVHRPRGLRKIRSAAPRKQRIMRIAPEVRWTYNTKPPEAVAKLSATASGEEDALSSLCQK